MSVAVAVAVGVAVSVGVCVAVGTRDVSAATIVLMASTSIATGSGVSGGSTEGEGSAPQLRMSTASRTRQYGLTCGAPFSLRPTQIEAGPGPHSRSVPSQPCRLLTDARVPPNHLRDVIPFEPDGIRVHLVRPVAEIPEIDPLIIHHVHHPDLARSLVQLVCPIGVEGNPAAIRRPSRMLVPLPSVDGQTTLVLVAWDPAS